MQVVNSQSIKIKSYLPTNKSGNPFFLFMSLFPAYIALIGLLCFSSRLKSEFYSMLSLRLFCIMFNYTSEARDRREELSTIISIPLGSFF